MSMITTITTYAELEQWEAAFVTPMGLTLLILVSSPGCGKSASLRAKLNGDDFCYTRASRLTAFQLYRLVYTNRNKAIVLDDVEDALKRSDTARLLMALCETDDEARTIAWLGTESLLTGRKGMKIVKIPHEFEARSRICILCNDWKIMTRKLGALLDRGTVVFFEPDAKEIHRYVGEWFKDKEIYKFIGDHLAEIPQHSIRYYVLAADQKRLGLDWKAVLMESWTNERPKGDRKEQLVRQLMEDPNLKTDKERIEAFKAHPDGGKRRTWYSIKNRLFRKV